MATQTDVSCQPPAPGPDRCRPSAPVATTARGLFLCRTPGPGPEDALRRGWAAARGPDRGRDTPGHSGRSALGRVAQVLRCPALPFLPDARKRGSDHVRRAGCERREATLPTKGWRPGSRRHRCRPAAGGEKTPRFLPDRGQRRCGGIRDLGRSVREARRRTHRMGAGVGAPQEKGDGGRGSAGVWAGCTCSCGCSGF